MRWDELFAGLETDLDSLQQSERDVEIADRTRVRLGQMSWVDRCAGARVGLRVQGVGLLRGMVDTVTSSWLLLHASGTTDWVVSLAAVTGVVDVPANASAPAKRRTVEQKMTWLNAWSVLSRDRDEVYVVRVDGTPVAGVADRVGKDFVEIGGELVPYVVMAAVRAPR